MNHCEASYIAYPTDDVAAGSFWGTGFQATIHPEFDRESREIRLCAYAKEGREPPLKGSVQIKLNRAEWMALSAFVNQKIAEADERQKWIDKMTGIH